MWRFAAGRTTGISHLKTGLPCQDRFVCTPFAKGGIIAAVADGAGSATRADVGAEIAVATAVEMATRQADAIVPDFKAVLVAAAEEAAAAVLTTARKEDRDARDFASTLLIVIATCSGGAALQIGDGVIVVSNGSEDWNWVFWPDRGEYANTTRFLTDEDALASVQVGEFAAPPMDVALMSDGLEPLALHYASKTVHPPFFNPLFRSLHTTEGDGEIAGLSRALEDFLASPRVAERSDDDLSLVIATRRPQCSDAS